MLSPGVVIDVAKLFEDTFGVRPYVIPGVSDNPESTQPGFNISQQYGNFGGQLVTPAGSLIGEKVNGVDIWLPIKLFDQDTLLMSLPYCVVRMSSRKHIVKTPMAERKGAVKELYSIEDYAITIKGFIISENRQFPEKELQQLKDLYEKSTAVSLENALTNIFLSDPALPRYEQRRIIIESLDLPEVQGGRKHVRPFSFQIESDTVFTLEYDV